MSHNWSIADGESLGPGTDAVGFEEPVDHHGGEARHAIELLDVADLGQFVDTQNRRRQDDLVTVVRALGKQVVLTADGDPRRGDQLLADRVQGWIRDLGEELREVVKKWSRKLRECRHGRIRTHRPDRLFAHLGHRSDDEAKVLFAVTEVLLLADN